MNWPSAGESSRTPTIPLASANSSSAVLLDPVTRSRTNLFLSIRASSVRRPPRPSRRYSVAYDDDSAAPNEESQGLLAGHSSGPPSAVAISFNSPPLPPIWIDLSDQVEAILAKTRTKIATLDKLHAKHALPGFSDRSAEEREIEAFTTDITRDFRKCGSLIQQITPGTGDTTFPPAAPSRNQVLTAQNVQRGLAAKVQDLSGTFRKKQRVYMQKLQGHASKNQDLLIASGVVSLKGSDSMAELEEDVEASRSQLKTQQQQQLLEPDLTTRTREITEIAKSIAQLAEVFKDLSTLVIDQGTILDSVEYNIEQTTVHVQEAAKDLDVATTYQKRTGRRSCMFLLVLIIVGLILVLIFKPRRSSAPPPPPSSTTTTAALPPREVFDTLLRREPGGSIDGSFRRRRSRRAAWY